MFMLALRQSLIPSTSKDLSWTEWETITPNKDGKNMGVHCFARALYDIQSQVIHKQGCKSITDVVKIRNFLNNIPAIIIRCITPHLTDDMTYNDIVCKSEQFEAANRGANSEHTKTVYLSEVTGYSNSTSTRSSYATEQPRPDNGQSSQNRLVTAGARSTASAGTKDSPCETIKTTVSETEQMRHVCEKVCLWCRLTAHNFKECGKPLNKEPMRTA